MGQSTTVEVETGQEVSGRLVSAATLESHKEAYADDMEDTDELITA